MNGVADSRSGFVVTVDFLISAEGREAFAALITENARRSLAQEPGCRQFDVVVTSANPDRVFLYEVYESAEAFEVHKRTAHFLAFDSAAAPYILERRITLGTRIHP